MIEVRVGTRIFRCGPIVQIRCVMHAKQIYRAPGARAGFLVVFAAALISSMILYFQEGRFHSHMALWGLGAAFGGAAGNLGDILRRRCIVDFIDLRWWPIFNIADIGIVGGLVAALWPRG